MKSKAEWIEARDGLRVEVASIVHEGRTFTNLGAMVSETHAVGYPKFPADSRHGRLLDWNGTELGTAVIVASWPIRSWMGSKMMQIECTIEGRTYTGRGFGSGMLWRGKAKRS